MYPIYTDALWTVSRMKYLATSRYYFIYLQHYNSKHEKEKEYTLCATGHPYGDQPTNQQHETIAIKPPINPILICVLLSST